MNKNQRLFLQQLYILCRKYGITKIDVDASECARVRFSSNGESLSFGSLIAEKESAKYLAIMTKQGAFCPELREEESE